MTPQLSAATPQPASPPRGDGRPLPSVLQTPVRSNGSPHPETPGPPAKPQATKSRKGRYYLIGAFIIIAAGGVAAYSVSGAAKTHRPDLILYKVRYEPLNLTVVERGALESADNREVTCRVRAGNKATALNIKWVIDDGAQVKAGDLLMEVDDSPLQDALKVEKIALDQARASWVAAEEQYKITVSQN